MLTVATVNVNGIRAAFRRGMAPWLESTDPDLLLMQEVRASDDVLRDELVAAVRREIGPVAAFRDVSVVDALPKTRSGKILRRTMRGIADGRDEPVPSTIEDPTVLDALRPVLRG